MNAEDTITIRIPVGQALTVTPSADGSGSVWAIDSAGIPGTPTEFSGSAVTFGPYGAQRVVAIAVTAGTADYTLAIPDPDSLTTDAEAAAAYQPRVGSDVLHLAVAGVPVDGLAGTGAGSAGPGSLCSDITNAKLYINGGTKASPAWNLITSA